MTSHLGEFAALLTTVFWTITALAFETASKRIGSMHVNLLRLGLATVFSHYFPFSTGDFFFRLMLISIPGPGLLFRELLVL